MMLHGEDKEIYFLYVEFHLFQNIVC